MNLGFSGGFINSPTNSWLVILLNQTQIQFLTRIFWYLSWIQIALPFWIYKGWKRSKDTSEIVSREKNLYLCVVRVLKNETGEDRGVVY